MKPMPTQPIACGQHVALQNCVMLPNTETF
jgi:hypothetical protein